MSCIIKNTTTKKLKPRQPVSSYRIVRWLLIQIEYVYIYIGPCRDLNTLSYLIYNRQGFRISFVLTAMAVTGLCPITFANTYISLKVRKRLSKNI